MEYHHEPVLVKEVLDAFALQSNQNIIDCTFGGGGHTREILKRIAPNGKVLGIDADAEALRSFPKHERLILVHGNFRDLEHLVLGCAFGPVFGILFDCGASSYHFDEQERGFSFLKEAALDMRFNREQELTAQTIVNEWPEGRLAEIFRAYGDERYARSIAEAIVRRRREHPIATTTQLAALVRAIYYRRSAIRKRLIDPATRVFQALRMAVNDELKNLELALPQAVNILEPHGRLAVITFHSGEDRIVKAFFRNEAKGCVCPPSFPICRCGKHPRLRIITKKAIVPTDEEIRRNPRARSAQLRVAGKLVVSS